MSVLVTVVVELYWTLQDAVPVVVVGASAHGEVVKVPVALLVKSTTWVGVMGGVTPDESVTVAVHVVEDPDVNVDGVHETVVVLVRKLTLTVVSTLLV